MSPPGLTVYTQERIAVVLAMVAGYVDAYGYLTFNTYVSFMSGNTTQAGMRIGMRDLVAAWPTLIAILFFIVGVGVGTLVEHSTPNRPRRLALGLVATSLVFVIALTELHTVNRVASEFPIAVLTFAMGILNTALSHVGAESVSLTFVTGTLAKIGNHLALAYARAPLRDAQGSWDTHGHRVLMLAGLWSAFFGGAVLAGAATPRFASWALLLPTIVLLGLSLSAHAMTRPTDVVEDSHA
jgi:uncharacterized membrane protein YoaK (UPF0700 family)